MSGKLAFIALLLILAPNIGYSACSHANLTRCLDSACAINMSLNPAARCQYCGTADAGAPDDAGMRSVSLGSSKYNISAKELKNAPTDPGERYVWATNKCLKLVNDCTTDDVADIYDPLIEQSCTAAGISAQMAVLLENARKTKSSATCNSEISACMIADTKCTSKYSGCADDSDFDKYFSECAVLANGCDEYLSDIRSKITKSRDSAIANAENILLAIVQSYQDARAKRIASIRNSCANNTERDACITAVCNRSMPNKCAYEYPAEKSRATQLCKFYDIACSTIK